jgi:hypothetical protein
MPQWRGWAAEGLRVWFGLVWFGLMAEGGWEMGDGRARDRKMGLSTGVDMSAPLMESSVLVS